MAFLLQFYNYLLSGFVNYFSLFQFIEFPAPTYMSKIRDWYGFVKWLEFLNYLLCFVGFFVHLSNAYYMAAKVIYCINAVIFYIRIMKVYTASSSLGPKLVMIKRMVCHYSDYSLCLAKSETETALQIIGGFEDNSEIFFLLIHVSR